MAKIRDSDRELQRILTSYEEYVLSSNETIQLPTPKVSVSVTLKLAADIFLRLPFDAAMDFLVGFLAGVDQQKCLCVIIAFSSSVMLYNLWTTIQTAK